MTNVPVLVVDDDPAIRDLLTDYLSSNDMRVTAVASGTQMNEAFDREAIDIVILDMRLPGEDGLQLARALRERATTRLESGALLLTRDGKELPIEDSGAPILGFDGSIAGAVLIFRFVPWAGGSQVQVPSLDGLTIEQATTTLNQYGLKLGAQAPQTSDRPVDTIIAQQPASGETLEQARTFEQGVAGRTDMLGRRPEKAGPRVGSVLPSRWVE